LRLAEELAIVDGTGRLGDLDVERLRRTLGEWLDDWRGLLRRQPVQARQILRKLVAGRLIFTPRIDEQGRHYEFGGHGTLGQVLTGAFHARAMVTPAGFEPAFPVRHALSSQRRAVKRCLVNYLGWGIRIP